MIQEIIHNWITNLGFEAERDPNGRDITLNLEDRSIDFYCNGDNVTIEVELFPDDKYGDSYGDDEYGDWLESTTTLNINDPQFFTKLRRACYPPPESFS